MTKGWRSEKKKLKKERRKCYLPQVKFKRNTSWSLYSCLSNSSSIREGWLANRDWPDARVETPATGPPTISRQCGSPKVTGAPQGHHQLFARAPIHLDILANSLATTNLCKCNTITSSLTLFFFKSMLHTHILVDIFPSHFLLHCNRIPFEDSLPLLQENGIYDNLFGTAIVWYNRKWILDFRFFSFWSELVLPETRQWSVSKKFVRVGKCVPSLKEKLYLEMFN